VKAIYTENIIFGTNVSKTTAYGI